MIECHFQAKITLKAAMIMCLAKPTAVIISLVNQ